MRSMRRDDDFDRLTEDVPDLWQADPSDLGPWPWVEDDDVAWPVDFGDWTDPDFPALLDDQDLPAGLQEGADIVPPEDEREPGEAGQGISSSWDVCAWYESRTHHGSWRICIRDECLDRIAAQMAWWVLPKGTKRMPRLAGARLKQTAFVLLFLHEQYHHKIESLAFRFGIVEGREIYRPYSSKVYSPTWRSPGALEEALANADAHRRLDEGRYSRALNPRASAASYLGDWRSDVRRYLKSQYRLAPPGYRDASRYLGVHYKDGEAELMAMVHEGTLTPGGNPHRFRHVTHMTRAIADIRAHIYLVVKAGAIPAVPIRPAPFRSSDAAAWRSDDGPMIYLATVEAVRILSKDGWVEVPGGGKGSHRKFRKDGHRPLVVPDGRKDLSPGVRRNIERATRH